MSSLHALIDWNYGSNGDDVLAGMLRNGSDPDGRFGPRDETPLHVAVRRRRMSAVAILLDHGAEIDAVTRGSKTGYAHAIRRGFTEVAALLLERGASADLTPADRLAVLLSEGRVDEARQLIDDTPQVVRTGNPEEDRLLADMAGRANSAIVELLISAGSDLTARGLDSGTPLHQAAWFGQPRNASLLVQAGAPIDIFDDVHESSPIGWAVHGSTCSGGAQDRQEEYVAVVRTLLAAGSSLSYPAPSEPGAYLARLLKDASPAVADVIRSSAGIDA